MSRIWSSSGFDSEDSMLIKVLAIVLVLVYVLSPIDIVPDMIPVLGRGDDLLLLLTLVYYLWKGTLPGFARRKWGGAGEAGKSGDAGRADEPTDKASTDPHDILGVPQGATAEEIKAAYRLASQQYHPDKVSHLGPELQELAKRKFISIQAAYEDLRRQGGW